MAEEDSAPKPTKDRSIVLVGLMGVGKTTVGRRLASALELPFVDSDAEIETAAGETIEEIFQNHGEAFFRSGERKVISRLLNGPKTVLATGGGAFMDPETRKLIKSNGISIWLKADLDVLLKRVTRRNHRPLLKTGDPKEILQRLIDERYPVYQEADLCVRSEETPHAATVRLIQSALFQFYEENSDS